MIRKYVCMGLSVLLANGLYEYVANQKCTYESLYDCIDYFLFPNLVFDLIAMFICAVIFTTVVWKNLSCKCKESKLRCPILILALVNIAILVDQYYDF
jgi:hypothetical protein